MSEEANEALQNILIFVKNNKSLMHLDLSHTEMQDTMIRPLIETIAQSESLMSVHLDGNPGLSQDLINFCIQTLGAKEIELVNHFASPPA